MEISSATSYSGRNFLHFKSEPDRFISVGQKVNAEKGFQYQVWAYVKFLEQVIKRKFGFVLISYIKTAGFYEKYG